MEEAGKLRKVDLGKLWDGSPAFGVLARFLEGASRLAKVEAAIAIGSRAAGSWRESSDIDVVIVFDRDVKSGLAELEGFGIVDPKPYALEELPHAVAACDTNLVEAFEGGKVVLDQGVWRKARGAYRIVKEAVSLERYQEGWKIARRAPLDELIEKVKLAIG